MYSRPRSWLKAMVSSRFLCRSTGGVMGADELETGVVDGLLDFGVRCVCSSQRIRLA